MYVFPIFFLKEVSNNEEEEQECQDPITNGLTL
jgi:hypothetical protein